MAVENASRLKMAGPIDPENGFPLWFEDTRGVRLELGLNPDPRTPAIGDLPRPGAPLSFPDNFPDESFYFLAEARLSVGGKGIQGRARVIFALEAAFGGAGTPKEGLNVVFARIRVRMDDLIPGANYKVTHPYGTIGFNEQDKLKPGFDEDKENKLEADENGRVFYTEDLGIVEGDPTAVLRSGKVAPFLKWAISVPNDGDGNEYIGDGANEQQITGSPFDTNFVIIEGRSIREGGGDPDPSDSNNPNKVWTDKFTVQGRKAKRVGASLTSATFAKETDGSFLLSIQAQSYAGQNLPLPDLRLVATGVHFKLNNEGEFYTGLGRAASVPSDARLVNITDSPPTSYPVKFTDLVIVESAVHDWTAGELTITAKSSDQDAVLKFNEKEISNPIKVGVAVPAEIIVKSSLGGEGRQRVAVIGTPTGNLPVEAIITPVPEVIAGETLTLNGNGSLGATNFAWSQNNGSPVTLTGANTEKVTFTPPTPGSYGFTLTVQGGDGTSANTNIDVIVQAKPQPGSDNLAFSLIDYRTARSQFRIEGSVNPDRVPNEIIVTFGDEKKEIGRSWADITGAWSVRRELLEGEPDYAALNPDPSGNNPIQASSKNDVKVGSLIFRN
jgi:hypothetical protein